MWKTNRLKKLTFAVVTVTNREGRMKSIIAFNYFSVEMEKETLIV